MRRNCCVCHVKLFTLSQYLIFIWWISLEKREYFNLNHSYSLGCLPYSIHPHYTYRSSLPFQLSDLLSLFILLPSLMLQPFGRVNFLLLTTLGKTRNLPEILRSCFLLQQWCLTYSYLWV